MLIVGILIVAGYIALITMLLMLRKKENSLQVTFGNTKGEMQKKLRRIVALSAVLVAASVVYYIFL